MKAMLTKATALLGVLVGSWAIMAVVVSIAWYAVKCAGRVVGWLP